MSKRPKRFDMLIVDGCTETGLFEHLSNHVFHSVDFRKYIGCESHFFFSKCLKFISNFRNRQKDGQEGFSS